MRSDFRFQISGFRVIYYRCTFHEPEDYSRRQVELAGGPITVETYKRGEVIEITRYLLSPLELPQGPVAVVSRDERKRAHNVLELLPRQLIEPGNVCVQPRECGWIIAASQLPGCRGDYSERRRRILLLRDG